MRELLLIDKSGMVIATSSKADIGADMSADALYLGGRKKPYIKDLFFSDEFKAPLMGVSAPVTNSAPAGSKELSQPGSPPTRYIIYLPTAPA